MVGIVTQSLGAYYTVESNNNIFRCIIRGKLRLIGFSSTNPIAVGDVVDFEKISENEGVIIKIHERRNCIIRKSTNLSKKSHIIASNIDKAIFIFTLRNPVTTTVFMDRYLVAAEAYNIPVVIVFNKIDIYTKEEIEQVAELMAVYHDIGYKVIGTSIKTGQNLDELKSELDNCVCVLGGHSGVGKSSLLNTIIPGLNLKTAEISEVHNSGKHTTTFARMIKLKENTYVIDTPGIRGFGIVDLKRDEIYHYFKEIFRISHNCKYYNCQHINEPGCAVKQALDDSEIYWTRYKSYLNIYFDEDDKHRQKEI